MRTLRVLVLTVAMGAVLVAAGCAKPATQLQPAENTSTPTTTPVATAPVGPMLGSAPTTMPSVIGLNLRIAAGRFAGMGEGARLFTDKYHADLATEIYAQRGVAVDDPVVTTTSPTPGALLHGDPIYLGTGPLKPRMVGGYKVGPWFFKHGPLVKRINDQGCWGCHPPQFCRRCHNGYKIGTAGMTHPPVTVESVVRKKVAALFPDKDITVSRVQVVSGTDGYAVYLVYTDPASATRQGRAATETKLAAAIAGAKLKGVGSLTVIWRDSAGRFAASDKVPLQ
jgi:hypothetical protein